jgi:hypothetical protein
MAEAIHVGLGEKSPKDQDWVSPAMTAGVADRLWSMEDVAELVEAAAPKPGPRGPYRKRAA